MNIDQEQQQEILRLRKANEERKYKNRQRQVSILWKIFAGLFIVLIIEIVLIFMTSPRLWVYRITVLFANDHTINTDEIIRLTELPERVNFNSLSLSDIEENIKKEPRIKTVLVRRGNLGIIVVNVTERKPVACIANTIPPVYIDSSGYIFTLPSKPKFDLPLVYGIQSSKINEYFGQIPTCIKGYQQIADCIQALNDPITHSKKLPIKKILLEKEKIYFELESGVLALLGAPEQLGIKIWALEQCMDEAINNGYELADIKHFDVRFPYIAYDNTGKIKYLRGTSYTFRNIDGN